MELAKPTFLERIPSQHRGSAALGFVLLGSLGIQGSTAIVSELFPVLGAAATSGLRMLVAAIFLVIVIRPNPFALKKSDWPQVIIYGFVAAFMTAAYYAAVQYIPLGIAVTIEYLGAFFIALLGIRRLRDGFLACGALVGVALIAGPTFGHYDLRGYLWAICTALCMTGYTLLSANMGRSSEATSGLKGLTLSIVLAAILLTPFSIPALPTVNAEGWLRLAIAGIFGVALAYSADSIAGRLTSSAVIGVLFALDPVVGSVVGWLFMGQILSFWTYAGITLIVVSGALLVWQTNKTGLAVPTSTTLLDAAVSTKTGQLPIIDPEKVNPRRPHPKE